MPQVGFEPTIPMFERVKTIHVLDRAATVIDSCHHRPHIYLSSNVTVEWMIVLLSIQDVPCSNLVTQKSYPN
jgi:hypothetical protein